MQAQLPYWLRATALPGVGPKTFHAWLSRFDNIAHLFQADAAAWLAAGIALKHHAALSQLQPVALEAALSWQARSPFHHIITFEDARYPLALKEMVDAPLILYGHGDAALLQRPQLAIVGARHATSLGCENAFNFAHALAAAGMTVTSGLALGIDAAAHEGALAADGSTIAVLGSGLTRLYPRTNIALAQRIVHSHGLLISEFPLQAAPEAHHFPRRNRLIAALSMGILVVEAALKSGSLITARLGLEMGKDIFALPGSIHQPLAKGCHALIRQGAKLTESAADIFEEYPWLIQRAVVKKSTKISLRPEEQHFLANFDYALTSIDMIISRSGLTPGQVSSMLLSLEMQGCIETVPGGYQRIS